MRYELMHKDVRVALIDILEEYGVILEVIEVYDYKHLPVGVVRGSDDTSSSTYDLSYIKNELEFWIRYRCIPHSRDGMYQVLEDKLHMRYNDNTFVLSLLSNGVSLSDQYWFRKESDSHLTYSDVNCFCNTFSSDIGDILFGSDSDTEESDGSSYNSSKINIDNISYHSPDCNTNGNLLKRWKIIEDEGHSNSSGKRCLLKGSSLPFRQEPYNEVIASRIMDLLGIEHTKYYLYRDSSTSDTYSVCEDFISSQTELVTAYSILKTYSKSNEVEVEVDGKDDGISDNGIKSTSTSTKTTSGSNCSTSSSIYNRLIECCSNLFDEDLVKTVRDSLNKMMVVDFLICNSDRHLNNFGWIRDASSLKYIGFAPIYDCGCSLLYNREIGFFSDSTMSTVREDIGCKPFRKSHVEQLQLVTDFSFIDLSKLEFSYFEEIVKDVFKDYYIGRREEYVTSRVDWILSLLRANVEYLKDYIVRFNSNGIAVKPEEEKS